MFSLSFEATPKQSYQSTFGNFIDLNFKQECVMEKQTKTYIYISLLLFLMRFYHYYYLQSFKKNSLKLLNKTLQHKKALSILNAWI